MSEVILARQVGSHAYGLATPESDIDILGVELMEMDDVLRGRESATRHATSDELDYTYHELGKFVSLALKANPTVLELLFIDEPSEYAVDSVLGDVLISNRGAFLSERVRKTYSGYALQQVKRLEKRGDYASDLKKRQRKHTRHIVRLMLQCEELLRTGNLHVKMSEDNIALVREIEVKPVEELVRWFEVMDGHIQNMPTILPKEPSTELVWDLVVGIRRGADNG